MSIEERPATAQEIVQVAHGVRKMRIEGPIGLQAAKSDLHRQRIKLGETQTSTIVRHGKKKFIYDNSMAKFIIDGKISEVISHINSRDAGNAT
jgi:hypothetical protein